VRNAQRGDSQKFPETSPETTPIRPLAAYMGRLGPALQRWRPDGPVPVVQVARLRRFLIDDACLAQCPLMPRSLLDDAYELTLVDGARG